MSPGRPHGPHRLYALLLLLAAASSAAAGCRAVLGIESLEVIDGGAGTGGDDGGVTDATLGADARPGDAGSLDAATHDAPIADAALPTDTSSPPAEIPDCGPQGSSCNMCCRSGLGTAEHTLEGYAVEAGCVCGTTSATCDECNDEAGAAFCSGNGPPPGPPSTCGPCVGLALASDAGPCAATQERCAADPNCRPVLECLEQCPAP